MSSSTLFKASFPIPNQELAVWAFACQFDSWLACEDELEHLRDGGRIVGRLVERPARGDLLLEIGDALLLLVELLGDGLRQRDIGDSHVTPPAGVTGRTG